MAKQTHIDELIDCSQMIVKAILNSKEVMGLIANNPDIDLDDPNIAEWEEHVFDHAWVDDTVQEAGAFVTVDVDIPDVPTGTIKDVRIYVEVLVSKAYMKLTPSLFKGVRGNRRDNIARQIDLLINGSKDFGIGRLDLASVMTTNTTNKFTGKLLVYEVNNFAKNRSVMVR